MKSKQIQPQSPEKALRESEERYKAFISQSTEGIWRFELEKPLSIKWPVKKQIDHIFSYGYLAECNDAMAKMYGFSKAKEIVGARLNELLIPSEEKNTLYLSTFIRSGYKLNNTESYEKDKFGNLHIFQNSLVGIVEDEVIHRAWGTQRDITAQKKAAEHQKFLENISSKLVVSIDHDITLQEIAQLIVPYFADYCRIAVLDDANNIKEIAVNHTDPTKVTLAADLYDAYKDTPHATHGIPSILKKGKPEIIAKIDDSLMQKYKENKKLLSIMKNLGLKSYMGIPLIARGKVLGAITFSSVREERYYTREDLLFVEEIGRRIALTLDNIKLFREAQEEIKKREQIAEILQLQQERLNLAQEAADIGVFEIDFPSKRVQWTVQLEKLHGLYPGTFKGTISAWLKLIHPEDRKNIKELLDGKSTPKSSTEFEYKIVLEDGSMRWIYCKAQVFFDNQRKPIRAVGINIDISMRKQEIVNSYFLAESSKILSASLDYETTLQNVASLVVPQIADWCIIDMIDKKNQVQHIAVTHKKPKKIKWAHQVRKAYPPTLRPDRGLGKVLRTGKSELIPVITDAMLDAGSKDKRYVDLLKQIGMTSVMMVPIPTKQKAIGVITLIRSENKKTFAQSDLTFAEELAHRAGLAIENAMLYKNAQDAITLRDDFISVASHELKTPITSVKIFTQVLQKHAQQKGDEKAIQSLGKMNKQIDKLTELVYNLLNVSKIQTGKLEYSMRKFAFDKMILESVEILQHMSAKHKLILEGNTNASIYGDQDRLNQVVSNLVLNAIKYSPSADKVHIKLSANESELKVAIQDFGIGMEKSHLEKVFDRFYRVSGNNDKTFPGLGIGLYISREIIQRHNGKLWVESNAGKGSTFYFTLPIKSMKRSPTSQVN